MPELARHYRTRTQLRGVDFSHSPASTAARDEAKATDVDTYHGCPPELERSIRQARNRPRLRHATTTLTQSSGPHSGTWPSRSLKLDHGSWWQGMCALVNDPDAEAHAVSSDRDGTKTPAWGQWSGPFREHAGHLLSHSVPIPAEYKASLIRRKGCSRLGSPRTLMTCACVTEVGTSAAASMQVASLGPDATSLPVGWCSTFFLRASQQTLASRNASCTLTSPPLPRVKGLGHFTVVAPLTNNSNRE